MYKRFEAETLKAAYQKVKTELGSNAQILTHRQVRQSGMSGMLGKKVWQVIAMNPPDGQGSPVPAKSRVRNPVDHVIDEPALPFAEFSKNDPAPAAPRRPAPSGSRPAEPAPNLERTALKILVKEVRALAEKLNATKPSAEHVILPGALPDVYRRLISQDIPREMAVDFMTGLCDRPSLDICDEAKILESLEERLAEQIPTAALETLFSSRRPRILFVVGPSGVGKTTTLAKIAMLAVREEKAKVALVTLDTFRIAAAEQLKTYADLMPADIEVVLSEEEFSSAVVRHADKDFILVDTPGKNPCSPAALSDFRDYLKRLSGAKLPAPAILMVLSASTKQSDLERYAACYRSLDPAGVVFTKLDETSSFGPILPVLHACRLPLVFLTA
ncbi:flagellar biosynthesis protein FlhF, partial [bacterium]|nr:flagellar biosynthesis protein FlhF [bacterium]